MKILIIATPRSGSTNLAWAIGKILNYKVFLEPFNYSHPATLAQKIPEVLPKKVIIKTIFSQVRKNDKRSSSEFYLEEIKRYDKVLILTRMDVKASYESYNYRIKKEPHGLWHTDYIYEEKKIDTELYCTYLEWVRDIVKFSKIIDIPIIWYEEIYNKDKSKVKNTLSNHGITVSDREIDKYFNIENKYRKTFKNKTLL